MREADFAGFGILSPADQRNSRGAVMRGAKGTLGNKSDFTGKFSGDRENFGDFERFRKSEGRKNRGKSFGEERFSGSRRSGKQDVVASRGRDLERALGVFLAFHVGHIEMIGLRLEKFFQILSGMGRDYFLPQKMCDEILEIVGIEKDRAGD